MNEKIDNNKKGKKKKSTTKKVEKKEKVIVEEEKELKNDNKKTNGFFLERYSIYRFVCVYIIFFVAITSLCLGSVIMSLEIEKHALKKLTKIDL